MVMHVRLFTSSTDFTAYVDGLVGRLKQEYQHIIARIDNMTRRSARSCTCILSLAEAY
jgi:hypothetical protein